MGKILELYQIMDKLIPGKQYCISVNGQQAVNAAAKLIGNRCYMPVKSDEIEYKDLYIGQLEIVLDDDRIYNGLPCKWVSLSFIPSENIIPAVIWLKNHGFENCHADIVQEDDQTSDYIPNYPHYAFTVPEKRLYISDNGSLCACKDLPGDKLVVFNDHGTIRKLDLLAQPQWDESKKAWYTFHMDDNGYYTKERLYSTEVIDKPKRKKKTFVPSKENCTVRIVPNFTTAKAYAIEDGSNGLIGKGSKVFYHYIAKSVCFVDEDGKIYAPVFAMKGMTTFYK